MYNYIIINDAHATVQENGAEMGLLLLALDESEIHLRYQSDMNGM